MIGKRGMGVIARKGARVLRGMLMQMNKKPVRFIPTRQACEFYAGCSTGSSSMSRVTWAPLRRVTGSVS